MGVEHGQMIQQLDGLDMAGDGRVTYHAIEWIDAGGQPCVDVCSQPKVADRHAYSAALRGAAAVARYAIIAGLNTELADALEFVRNNTRLGNAGP
jgi:hypothetical protein